VTVTLPAVMGVRLQLQPFWLGAYFLLALGIFVLGVPGTEPLLPGFGALLGAVGALLLLASYGAHELTHGIAGHALGEPISQVTLFGLVDRTKAPPEPPSGRAEVLFSLSGVVVSYVLGGLFGLAFLAMPAAADEATAFARGVLWWGAVGNLALAIINSAPAYPYDGGRVVRGVIWSATNDKLRATRIASAVGRGFAVGLLFVGAFWAFVTGDFFLPLWMIVAGVFLLQSSRRQLRRLEIGQAVEGLTVGDVMEERVDVVGPNLTIDTLYSQFERDNDVISYPVTANGQLVGEIDIAQIERVPRPEWQRTRVGDVMTDLEGLPTMTRGQSVMDALLRFDASSVDAIPVVDETDPRQLIGLLTRERLVDRLQPRVKRGPGPKRPAKARS
jgi:CBS domain-containing protein/Zn-dependent protease